MRKKASSRAATNFTDKGSFSIFLDQTADEQQKKEEQEIIDTDSFREAMKLADELSAEYGDERGITIYENGTLEGTSRTETVMFWWNKCAADFWGVAAKGRGFAYVIPEVGASRFIEYVPVAVEDDTEQEDEVNSSDTDEEVGTALTASSPVVEDEEEEQEEGYVKTHCDDCGLIMPLYKANAYSYDEKVGSSSGSTRVGRSSRRRTSSTGRTSYSSGSSGSVSSGRSYYKTKKILLCDECFKTRKSDDRIWFWFKAIIIVVGIILLYVARAFHLI